MSHSTKLFLGGDDPQLSEVGHVGFDTAPDDSGSGTTLRASVTTNVHHPAGKNGLFHFRRIAFRFLRASPELNLDVTVYVDGTQTQIYSDGDLVNQDFTITTTGGGIREEIIELDMNAVGTSIQVEAIFDAGDAAPTGTVMLETIEVHGRAIRQALQRAAEVGS